MKENYMKEQSNNKNNNEGKENNTNSNNINNESNVHNFRSSIKKKIYAQPHQRCRLSNHTMRRKKLKKMRMEESGRLETERANEMMTEKTLATTTTTATTTITTTSTLLTQIPTDYDYYDDYKYEDDNDDEEENELANSTYDMSSAVNTLPELPELSTTSATTSRATITPNTNATTSTTTRTRIATMIATATPPTSALTSVTDMLATFLISSTTLATNNGATSAALTAIANLGAVFLDERGSNTSTSSGDSEISSNLSSVSNRFVREDTSGSSGSIAAAAEASAYSSQSGMHDITFATATALAAGFGNFSISSTNFSSIFGSSPTSLNGIESGSGSSEAATTYGLVTTSTNGDISFNDSDDMLTEDATEYIFDRTDVRIIFITLYTLVFCCCFFGNLLVILVVTLSRRLRSITNFFLANLALADFCVGLFCVMQNLSIYLIDSWVFGEFLCRMYQFVHSLSYTASIFILVVICMERYFAIVHPITCKQILTAARLRMVILTVWITSAVYSTPKFVFSKTIKNIHNEDGQEEEICVLDRKMFNSKLLDMINFGLLYVIPLLVMTVLYSKIAIALWRSSRGLSHQIAQQQQQDNNSLNMHNSMYHHHNHHHHHHHAQHSQHHHLQHHNQQQQQQQQQQQHNHNLQQQSPLPPDTPISMASSAGSAILSRKQSSKYEKRGASISESQVSLESDRPIVSACRKTSFYNQHHHQQQPHHHTSNHQNVHSSQTRYASTQRGVAAHISHSSNNVLRARRGVVRMLIIFVLTFALCNLPYHARKMWQYWSRSYRGDSNFNALLTPLTFLVTYFNSGVNPLLYAFLSRNFRKGMKELLLCSWKKGKGKLSTNSSMHHKRVALQTHSLPTDVTHIGNEQV